MIQNLERYDGKDCHVVVDTDKGKLYGRGLFVRNGKAFCLEGQDRKSVMLDWTDYIYTIQLAKKEAPAK